MSADVFLKNIKHFKILYDILRLEPEKFRSSFLEFVSLDYPVNFVPPGEQNSLLHYSLESYKCCELLIPEFLIEAGADVKIKGKYQSTPLHLAVQWHPKLTLVQLMISNGADIKATDCWGSSIINEACKTAIKGYGEDVRKLAKKTVKLLIDLGEDPFATDSEIGDWRKEYADKQEKIKFIHFLQTYIEAKGGKQTSYMFEL